VRVHDPIIVHHSNHQPTRESVPIEKGHRGHRERQQTVPQAVEGFCEEARGGSRVVEVQPIRIKLGESAGGDDYAWGVLGLDDVEG
jgi:hypothetical protein